MSVLFHEGRARSFLLSELRRQDVVLPSFIEGHDLLTTTTHASKWCISSTYKHRFTTLIELIDALVFVDKSAVFTFHSHLDYQENHLS